MSRYSQDYGLKYAQYASFDYRTATGSCYGTVMVTGPGKFVGLMVSSISNGLGSTGSPWVALYDSLNDTGGWQSGGSTIMAIFKATAGTMYSFGAPVYFQTGLYLFSGGSLTASIAYY